jgi:glycosyltransferase involved in cell wall biosynthesis
MLDVYRRVNVISAQSNAAIKLIQNQGIHIPIFPISCGIDLHLYHPDPQVDQQMYRQRFGIDPNRKIFLFLGRIDGEKHIDLLLQAMKQLSRKDIQMVIAGHGKVEDSLRWMAADMQINQNIRFTGFIPAEDVPGLMNSVDVFVMPSEAELLSISTLEAMACGRPVLLANALALPELVREGENGYLFKPGDVTDIARYINVLADQSERWETMGKVSREIALAHDLDDTIKSFEIIYSQLVSQGPVAEIKLEVRTSV